MQFHVSIAFWELLRERSPQTAELVQPKFTDHRQIFEVKLFEGKPRRIDQPTDLETFMEKIDKNGKRIPSKSMLENKSQPNLCYLDGSTIFWLLLVLWSLQY